MKAVILAGGKGTRLRPLTVYTPKPIVPFCNRPFLLYQIDILKRAGITDITLSLSYQPDKIELLLGDGAELGVDLTFITEPSPLGTGGAYRFAADKLSDTTVVLNGDILTNVDISSILDHHRAKKADATIALMSVEDPAAYGLVRTDDEGRVRQFLEKPAAAEVSDLTVNTINAGIYVLEPSIRSLVEEGENRSFEYDVFPRMLERQLPFFAYDMDGAYWRDIGTPESYLAAHHDFLDGTLRKFNRPKSEAFDAATVSSIDKRSVIGEGSTIKPGAVIRNSVIGPGVLIEEKAEVEDSVVWAHTRIATSAEVRGSIIGRGCHIGRNSVLRPGTVLGDKTTLTDYTRA